MVTLLPGRTMEPDELRLDTLYSFGVTCARLGRALRGFFHPSAGHPLLWNIKHALALRPLVQHIPDAARRATVDEVLDRFEEHVEPGLRRPAGPGDPQRPDARQLPVRCRATGLGRSIDFGDMAHSALVCDFVSTVEPLDGRTARPFRVAGVDRRGVRLDHAVPRRRDRAAPRPAAGALGHDRGDLGVARPELPGERRVHHRMGRRASGPCSTPTATSGLARVRTAASAKR